MKFMSLHIREIYGRHDDGNFPNPPDGEVIQFVLRASLANDGPK